MSDFCIAKEGKSLMFKEKGEGYKVSLVDKTGCTMVDLELRDLVYLVECLEDKILIERRMTYEND